MGMHHLWDTSNLLSTSNLLILISFIITAIALSLVNIFWLRVCYLIAAILVVISSLISGFLGSALSNLLFIIINSVQIVILLLNKREIILPKELQKIKSNVFSDLTSRDFLKLYEHSTPVDYEKNTIVVQNNSIMDHIILLLDGKCIVEKKNVIMAELDHYQFIGEMQWIADIDASATVRTASRSHCLVWKHDDLNKLKIKNYSLYIQFYNAVARHLVQKLILMNSQLSIERTNYKIV